MLIKALFSIRYCQLNLFIILHSSFFINKQQTYEKEIIYFRDSFVGRDSFDLCPNCGAGD
jgi:hypothetical protein